MTYITNRIIACGFPAEGIEAAYRNRRDDIVRFLKKNHGNMVKIYNLCAEPAYQYTANSVECAISRFPFFDHNVASLKKMYEFCLDAALFLQRIEQYHKLKLEFMQQNGYQPHSKWYQHNLEATQERQNKEPVIVVHCKAGKGRTGMMICALLVFLNMFESEDKARNHYDDQRAKPGTKALTIKSQQRYVKFFEGFLYYKLAECASPTKSFFETALIRRNYMSCSGVFEDM
jgi:phosphatidylinositol-3,4,5-trisphosphate 3-phosphatase and dual-specificity protein phosphatase PTEN